MSGPLDGLAVVEVAVGASDLGLGLAGGIPGRLFADLGATVTRVVGTTTPGIDEDVPWGRVWHRGKDVVATDDPAEVGSRLRTADVAFVYGPEALVEGRGLGYDDASGTNPSLVYARSAPSRTAAGEVEDFGLLVEARAGFCTQLAAHRPGPMLVDVRASGSGAAFLLTTSTLALLRRRTITGAGGRAETSLYDGMLATLGCMIGRSERAEPKIESYWAEGSFFPNFLYRCADGELIQIWMGGKGMYPKIIDVLGDDPSEDGYYAEQMTGLLNARAVRWREVFVTEPRSVWIERLRSVGVACEPVGRPGEALTDPHVTEIGLAVHDTAEGHDDVLVGPLIAIEPVAGATTAPIPTPTPAQAPPPTAPIPTPAPAQTPPPTAPIPTLAPAQTPPPTAPIPTLAPAQTPPPTAPIPTLAPPQTPPPSAPIPTPAPAQALRPTAEVVGPDHRSTPGARPTHAGARLLDGVRVVDFSAFVAGPLAAEVLADLGADVIKVEPPQGEAMRAAAYAIAACQRGKRSLAMDIGAPEARPVVETLLRQADVVLHNFRVGVSERLGIDEATVAKLNPRAVYCHAAAFGPTGPRADHPATDALMQAFTGFETAIGGEGNEPTAATWIPIDISGGWLAAAGILAGLYARAAGGTGQLVSTSLLGAGMLLHSGVFQRDGKIVRGPALDGDQTGYGPGYRLYRCADDTWSALVIPDADAWERLRSFPEAADLPAEYAPLRGGPQDMAARRAEVVLEAAFLTAPASTWVERLRPLGLLAEVVDDLDRDGFRRRILDDPLNRELGRAVTYDTADWGRFDQIGPLLRCGPDVEGGPSLHLPGVGEHTVEVLTELGLTPAEIEALLTTKVAHQG